MIRKACGLTIADADDAEALSSAPTTPVCPVCGAIPLYHKASHTTGLLEQWLCFLFIFSKADQ